MKIASEYDRTLVILMQLYDETEYLCTTDAL